MLSVFRLDLAFLTSLQTKNNPSEKTGNTSRSNPRDHAQDGPENLKTTNDGTISALDLTGRTLRIPDSIHQKRIDENGDEFACQYDQCSHLKAFLDLPGAQSPKENSAKSDERGGSNYTNAIQNKRETWIIFQHQKGQECGDRHQQKALEPEQPVREKG